MFKKNLRPYKCFGYKSYRDLGCAAKITSRPVLSSKSLKKLFKAEKYFSSDTIALSPLIAGPEWKGMYWSKKTA